MTMFYDASMQQEYNDSRGMLKFWGWAIVVTLACLLYFGRKAFFGLEQDMYVAIHGTLALVAFLCFMGSLMGLVVYARRVVRLERIFQREIGRRQGIARDINLVRAIQRNPKGAVISTAAEVGAV